MTNIEKVKRILDAGHWVKATDKDGVVYTIYAQPEDGWVISYKVDDGELELFQINEWEDCTIEVIQRIPTPYKAGEKVLVLSNPRNDVKKMYDFVGNNCDVICTNYGETLISYKGNESYFPSYCLSPAFEDDQDTDLILSGKEVTVTIDGKEYTAVIK